MSKLVASLALGLALVGMRPAFAALSQADLDTVSVHPKSGAVVPGDLVFFDENDRRVALGSLMGDRPTLLVMADYDCHLICGPILAATAATLRRTGLVAGRDFNFVVVGINPAATRGDAERMKADQLGGDAGLAAAAHFLRAEPGPLAALALAINYRTIEDPEARRFAHPTDLLALTSDRRVSQVLPGLSTDPAQLRSALVEAGAGVLGEIVDRVHVLCYGLDPAHGVYDGPVRATLIGAGGLTLVGLGAAMAAATRGRRRP